jgi:hypothetical protein
MVPNHLVLKASLCLPRWFRVKLGVNTQEPQSVNIHGKCGVKIVYNRSLKRKWPRLLKRWKIFFGTKESFELTIAKLDECMTTYKPSNQLEVLLNIK